MSVSIGHRKLEPWLLLAVVALGACAGPDREDTSGGADGAVRITAWAHAGQDAERSVLEDQALRFNRSRADVRVELTFLPEGSYNEQVQAAALAGDLPDVLELDGPFVAAYAWQGHLAPLDSLIPPQTREGLLPSIVRQGTYRGRLWALGAFDSGLGLFVRRSALERIGAPLPDRPEDAWTAMELEDWMAALAATDRDGAVLDLHLNYPGEWYTYAFAPVLHSAGAGLLAMEPLGA